MPFRLRGVLAAFALLFAACSTSPAVEQHPPRRGGVLRVTVRDLSTLDPAKASGRGAEFVLDQIFDPLVRMDPTGKPMPGAASSWDTSADGLTWTFHIAKASFDNGDPVTAWDFKFAFDRLTAKSTGSDTAYQLENVTGFKASKVDGTATKLAGVKIVNDSTLRISLDRSFAELPLYLAHPSLGPVSQKIFNKDPSAFASSPVGNGPFKVGAAKTDSGIDLIRSNSYAGQASYLDGIHIVLQPDADRGWKDWQDGKTDIAEVPANAIAAGSSSAKFGPEGFTPFWAAVYYGANLRLPKFKDARFRKAISIAIDRAAVARTVYGGTKTPATGLIPKGIDGFGLQRCDACTHALDEAKKLISDVFGAKPPSVIIDHLDASPSREVAAAIAANLREAGLTIALRAHSSAEYLRLLQAGKQELAELGWLSAVPSPDGFLAQQLHTGSPNNQTAFSDAQFDGFIDKARAETDDEKRDDLYKQAEVRALQLMPLIPVVFFRNHVAVSTRVHGFVLDGAGEFDASKTWIAVS